MKYSKHYKRDRKERNEIITSIGMGDVIYTTVQYDKKRGRSFKYEITNHAVLIVYATDEEKIITQMIARPKRILQYWSDAPQWLLDFAWECQQKKYNI